MEIKTSRHPLINTLANTNLTRKPHSIREVEERNRCRPVSDIVLVAEVWELTIPAWKAVRSLRAKAVVSNITEHSFRLLLRCVAPIGQLC